MYLKDISFHAGINLINKGALVGTLFACVTLVVCADIFNKHSIFWRSFEKYGTPRRNCSTANKKESGTKNKADAHRCLCVLLNVPVQDVNGLLLSLTNT